MKIDRLLGIVIYLLNRDIVSGNTLAEKFEVSPRTIQRDIETLNLAGIPIFSIQGVNGGYGIVDSFKLDKQLTNGEDYKFIITALKGLNSAYDNKKLEITLEKMLNLSKLEADKSNSLRFDFSVSREGNNIVESLKIIERTIEMEQSIEFEYTNSYWDTSVKKVEPIGAIYKWYAWYMFAYYPKRCDYRLFKIARMRDVKNLEEPFSKKHDSLDKLLVDQEKKDNREYINVRVVCKEEIRVPIEEYFPNGKITCNDIGEFVLEFVAVENEIGWKGLLFAFGNKVRIIAPKELREEFIIKAKEIINNY